MNLCTPLCGKIATVSRSKEPLPLHDDLVKQLEFTDDDRELGRYLGKWSELRKRHYCDFCRLVVVAISNSIGPTQKEQVDFDRSIRVFIFPGEQSFRLSYPSLLGLRLAFVAEEFDRVGGPDTARPMKYAQPDTARIQTWLQTCDGNHDACSLDDTKYDDDQVAAGLKIKFPKSASSSFRVIDLELGCVKSVDLGVQYVTLSYVWGQLPMFRLSKENYEKLSEEGSLHTIRNELPRTVNDAIDLVKALSLRYLWVDGLCLIQDDERDVREGIERMKSIYHESYFTLVAGSGSDASAGLYGMSNQRQHGALSLTEHGGSRSRLAILYSIDKLLDDSTYRTRGWTFQEFVLPRRTLIFINGQAHFRCREANWSEDSWANEWIHCLDADDSNILRVPDPDDGFMPSLWAYQKLMEEYSSRKLRNDGDVLRAVAGVVRPMAAGMDTLLIEGLPGYYLDHFLLFISHSGNLRRRTNFGSFSWAGWEGRIMWPRDNFVWFDTLDSGAQMSQWHTENILRYFQNYGIIDWKALQSDAELKSLTWHEEPSPLLKLMEEYPNIFPAPLKDPIRGFEEKWNNASSLSGGIPRWKSSHRDPDNDPIQSKLKKAKPLSIRIFDLANSQAEFDRLIKRIHLPVQRKWLHNWMAGRRWYPANESRFHVRLDHMDHFGFRTPQTALSEEQLEELWRKDKRTQVGIRRLKSHTPEEDEVSNDHTHIPKFPPYTVLQFTTISLHLKLGAVPSESSTLNVSTESERIAGIPLYSGNEVTGSLHPDNLAILSPEGTSIECLIISRCNTPTESSALLKLNSAKEEGTWKLFWILYVVTEDGIAERRGVGQILSSALETKEDPKPAVKTILLG